MPWFMLEVLGYGAAICTTVASRSTTDAPCPILRPQNVYVPAPRVSVALPCTTRSPYVPGGRVCEPFFGTMTVYQWVELMAAHEGRHTKQIREIAAAFS